MAGTSESKSLHQDGGSTAMNGPHFRSRPPQLLWQADQSQLQLLGQSAKEDDTQGDAASYGSHEYNVISVQLEKL